jgi:hypothetical protein
MILVNTPSFIATTLETQTSTKLDKLVVNYSTRLGVKGDRPQGYVDSYICTTDAGFIYSLPAIEMEVFTSDILVELHGMYIFHLSNLNPSLTFTSTL